MPDSNRTYYARHYHADTTIPGSADAIVVMHINTFGNTSRIMEGECENNRAKQIERLDKISDMIRVNKEKIENYNNMLRDKNSYVWLFNKEAGVRKELRQFHRVRERLKQMWVKQLELMKY